MGFQSIRTPPRSKTIVSIMFELLIYEDINHVVFGDSKLRIQRQPKTKVVPLMPTPTEIQVVKKPDLPTGLSLIIYRLSKPYLFAPEYPYNDT